MKVQELKQIAKEIESMQYEAMVNFKIRSTENNAEELAYLTAISIAFGNEPEDLTYQDFGKYQYLMEAAEETWSNATAEQVIRTGQVLTGIGL